MANLIQIKRSLGTGAAAAPGSLQPGELAFTSNGNVLFVGNSSSVVAVGGARTPGTLTANQALVANSTSGIDKIITANLTLSSFSVDTINAVANLTNLGAAGNNELTTTWAIKTFVDAKIAQASNPQGSNGQFQYNDSGVLAGTNNMVFDKSTGQISIGNSSTNVQIGYTGSINSLAHFHGNQNSYVQVVMNNVNNGTRSSSDFVAENDIGDESSNYVDLGINSSNYNDTAFSAMGAGDAYLYTANNDLVIGTADTGGEVKFITSGTTSSQIRAVIDGGGNVAIGATTADARLKVSGTSNLTGNVAIGGITTFNGNLVVGSSGISVNGSFGDAGQVLYSNGSAGYWANISAGIAGSNTQIQFNDSGVLAGDAGLTFNKTTDTLSTNSVSANTISLAGNVASSNLTTGTLTVTGGIGVTGRINTGDLAAGNDSVYSSLTGTSLTTANVFASQTVNALVLSVGGWVIANQSGVFTSGVVNGDILSVGTSFKANTTQVVIGSGIGLSANSSTGSAGQVLHTNGTSVYWDTDDQGVTSVATGNGMTGGTITTTGTVSVLANNGIVANSSGVFARAANGISVDSSGINVTGGDGLVSNASGVHVGAANGISVSSDAVAVNGGSTLTVNTSGVHVNSTLSIQDLTLAGNLVVQGTLTTLDTTNLAVEDPLIALAINQANTATYIDADDIGLYGSFGNTSQKIYTGLFRDQTDNIYKLFTGQIPEPTTTVDTSNVNFAFARLQSFLTSSGLFTNSSVVNITANSTVSAAIVANTLSLSTALPATSGGTGQSSYTAGDLLTAANGTHLSKLALGTDGYVLQSNGTAVVYATLDGGTF